MVLQLLSQSCHSELRVYVFQKLVTIMERVVFPLARRIIALRVEHGMAISQ